MNGFSPCEKKRAKLSTKDLQTKLPAVGVILKVRLHYAFKRVITLFLPAKGQSKELSTLVYFQRDLGHQEMKAHFRTSLIHINKI